MNWEIGIDIYKLLSNHSLNYHPLRFYLFTFFFRILCLFIYFLNGFFLPSFLPFFLSSWLRWVSVAARGLSLVAVSGGYSLLWCTAFSLRWLLLLQSTGSRRAGFSSCGMWAQQLWCTGLVAPRHVGSSQTGSRTHVPFPGRWILNHCATREVPTKILVQVINTNPGCIICQNFFLCRHHLPFNFMML